eukprot:TRINITY_DN17337_c0_g1_i2.p1 TRINITY_DN17337_c0_g1~~TRINITY_DN17337_c0_g1_i2.p1  ORF type:complete len:349 (+),score=81.26 TRINITY_DN17337_c0_g1_i2:68-1114(+)
MIFVLGNYVFRALFGTVNLGVTTVWKLANGDLKGLHHPEWVEGAPPSKEFIEFDRMLRSNKPAVNIFFNVQLTRLAMHGMRALIKPRKSGHTEYIAGVRCLVIKQEHTSHRRVVLHIHGGGFMSGQPEQYTSYLRELSDTADATIISVDYRRVPEHAMPSGKYDCIRVYKHLLEIDGIKPENISMTGDSAGGGMVLLVMQALVRQNVAVPGCAIMLSPWTDVTMNKTKFYLENEHKDCFLDGTTMHYVASIVGGVKTEEDRLTLERNPTYSALYGSFEGLPPLYFITGSHEVLLDDTLRAVQKAEEAGVPTKTWIARNMCHVFPCFPGVFPEARHAIGRIASFIEHHT